MLRAAREYARGLLAADARVRRVGLFGSYARDEAGPGSDADLLVELSESDQAATRRPLGLPAPRLPVPADLLVLTAAEISVLRTRSPRWSREVYEGACWLAEREQPIDPGPGPT